MLRYCVIGLLWPVFLLAGDAPPDKLRTAPATQPARDHFDDLIKKYIDLSKKLRGTDDLSKKGEWRRELGETVREMLELRLNRAETRRRSHPFVIDPLPNWVPPAGSVPRSFNGQQYWVMPLDQQDPFVHKRAGVQHAPLEIDEFRLSRLQMYPIGPLILPSDPQHVNNRPRN